MFLSTVAKPKICKPRNKLLRYIVQKLRIQNQGKISALILSLEKEPSNFSLKTLNHKSLILNLLSLAATHRAKEILTAPFTRCSIIVCHQLFQHRHVEKFFYSTYCCRHLFPSPRSEFKYSDLVSWFFVLPS